MNGLSNIQEYGRLYVIQMEKKQGHLLIETVLTVQKTSVQLPEAPEVKEQQKWMTVTMTGGRYRSNTRTDASDDRRRSNSGGTRSRGTSARSRERSQDIDDRYMETDDEKLDFD